MEWSPNADGTMLCASCGTTFQPPSSCACVDVSEPITVEIPDNPYKDQVLALMGRLDEMRGEVARLRDQVRAAEEGSEYAPVLQALIEQERKLIALQLETYKGLARLRALEIAAESAMALRGVN